VLQFGFDEDLEATHAVDVTDAKKPRSSFVVFDMNGSRLDTAQSPWYRALIGALAALVPACLMWGFTVDDALISIRYAHHLVTGAGYAFNAHAAATDGVTPLPWVFVLAPLSRSADLLDALVRAKVLGILAWTAAGAALGARMPRAWPLAFVAAAFPIGAWAASGMETGLATALATFAAVSFERPNRAALFAGLAASLRPELVPWALTITIGASISGGPRLLPPLISFTPFAVCTLIRLLAFGAPVPLAVAAKPSDASHGIVYAVAALVVGLLPLLVLAPFALKPASARAKVLVVALLVHALVMVAVGGDWMPFARLIVPILPGLALAAADIAAVARPAATIARALVAAALALYTMTGAAPSGRHVQRDRAELIARARPVLASSKVIAALDIGWVGAAADATIVDLAGLTDPSIALLPGGHTSKSVDLAMLLDRHVDTILVYTPPRQVENRLLHAPLFAERFEATDKLPLGETEYVVFRRRTGPGSEGTPAAGSSTQGVDANPAE
jgi:hypothetical protein